jgi:hypothetical protein
LRRRDGATVSERYCLWISVAQRLAAILRASAGAAQSQPRNAYLKWLDGAKRRPQVRQARLREFVQCLTAGKKSRREDPPTVRIPPHNDHIRALGCSRRGQLIRKTASGAGGRRHRSDIGCSRQSLDTSTFVNSFGACGCERLANARSQADDEI